jgi:hypothetical protein
MSIKLLIGALANRNRFFELRFALVLLLLSMVHIGKASEPYAPHNWRVTFIKNGYDYHLSWRYDEAHNPVMFSTNSDWSNPLPPNEGAINMTNEGRPIYGESSGTFQWIGPAADRPWGVWIYETSAATADYTQTGEFIIRDAFSSPYARPRMLSNGMMQATRAGKRLQYRMLEGNVVSITVDMFARADHAGPGCRAKVSTSYNAQLAPRFATSYLQVSPGNTRAVRMPDVDYFGLMIPNYAQEMNPVDFIDPFLTLRRADIGIRPLRRTFPPNATYFCYLEGAVRDYPYNENAGVWNWSGANKVLFEYWTATLAPFVEHPYYEYIDGEVRFGGIDGTEAFPSLIYDSPGGGTFGGKLQARFHFPIDGVQEIGVAPGLREHSRGESLVPDNPELPSGFMHVSQSYSCTRTSRTQSLQVANEWAGLMVDWTDCIPHKGVNYGARILATFLQLASSFEENKSFTHSFVIAGNREAEFQASYSYSVANPTDRLISPWPPDPNDPPTAYAWRVRLYPVYDHFISHGQGYTEHGFQGDVLIDHKFMSQFTQRYEFVKVLGNP